MEQEAAEAEIRRIYGKLGVDKTSGYIEQIKSLDGGLTYQVTRSDRKVAIVQGLDLDNRNESEIAASLCQFSNETGV